MALNCVLPIVKLLAFAKAILETREVGVVVVERESR
jgi:hypothetical protein